MDALQQLIDQERAKLAILEKELAERKARIAVLESMRSESKLDAVLSEKLSPTQPSVKSATNTSEKSELRKAGWPLPAQSVKAEPQPHAASTVEARKHGEVKRALLSALTEQPMSLSEIAAKLDFALGDRLRVALWNLKRQGLVENPSKGYFCLSSAASAADQKGEALGLSANGDSQSEGFMLQPSPSYGTAGKAD